MIIHLSTTGESYGWLYIKRSPLFFFIHGWMLWIGWGVLGFWQIGTMRYLKPFYRPSVWFHIINGTFILLVTLIFCIKGIATLHWTVSFHWHAKVGIAITSIVTLVPAGGILTYYYHLKSKWSIDIY